MFSMDALGGGLGKFGVAMLSLGSFVLLGSSSSNRRISSRQIQQNRGFNVLKSLI